MEHRSASPPAAGWRERARRLEREALTLYLAARHPRVPWYVKLGLLLPVAYLFSPIDLVPDPVPVLGHLDDLVRVPPGVALAWRMIAPEALDVVLDRGLGEAQTLGDLAVAQPTRPQRRHLPLARRPPSVAPGFRTAGSRGGKRFDPPPA